MVILYHIQTQDMIRYVFVTDFISITASVAYVVVAQRGSQRAIIASCVNATKSN